MFYLYGKILHTGDKCGSGFQQWVLISRVLEVVVDPDTGKIVGFYCFQKGKRFLLLQILFLGSAYRCPGCR